MRLRSHSRPHVRRPLTHLLPAAVIALLALPLFLQAAPDDTETISLEKLTVTPGSYQATTDPVAAPLVIDSATLQALPQFGDDLYRTLAHFPGLAADDFSARFWVRGAPHQQILTRLDGVDLLEPFHLKDFDGSLSIVDAPSIDRLTLHTGGFTSEYGNSAAAVIEFDTDARPARALRSTLNASIIGLRFANEGAFAQSRGEWLVAARLGLPEITLDMLDDDDLGANYHDVRAKLAYRLNPQHHLSVNFLRADDNLTYREVEGPLLKSSYQSHYLWTRLRSAWTPRLHAETVLSLTALDTLRKGDGLLSPITRLELRDERALTRLQLRQDWTYSATDDLFLRAGLDLQHARNRYNYARLRQRVVLRNGQPVVEDQVVSHDLNPSGDSLGLYVTPRIRLLPTLIVEPGVRFDHATLNHSSELSPRLNACLTFGPATVRAGWGLYRQHQDLHQLAVPDGDLTFHPSERTEQRTLGLERPLGPLHLRVELYERLGQNPPPRFENIANGYDTFLEIRSDRLRLAPTESRARGVEFNLTRRTRQLDTSLSYTLSRTEEKIANRWTPRARDQRHALGLNLVYTPNDRWRLAASWHYHTGWATSEPRYELVGLLDGRNVIRASYDGLYDRRLPAYHRLDFRLNRRFRWSGKTLDVYVDLFNAYDRANLIGYTSTVTIENGAIVATREREKQFPLLPNLGLSLEF